MAKYVIDVPEVCGRESAYDLSDERLLPLICKVLGLAAGGRKCTISVEHDSFTSSIVRVAIWENGTAYELYLPIAYGLVGSGVWVKESHVLLLERILKKRYQSSIPTECVAPTE